VTRILILFCLVGSTVFFILTQLSTVDSKYKCNGEIEYESEAYSQTIYLKIEKYRWWVLLWSNASHGSMWAEVPNSVSRPYSRLHKVGESYLIYYGRDELAGKLSQLSGALTLNLHVGFFEGQCEQI
jgi:hypothetical protein